MTRKSLRVMVVAAFAALVVLHAVPHALGTVTPPLRVALVQAGEIANGHLVAAPAGSYLLALALAVNSSVTAAMLALGLVASLKFVLAWACGRAVGDARLGIAWAACLALSPLALVQPLFPVPMHGVEVAVLAALWPLLRLWRGADAHWWGAFGLLSGLALHAHWAAAAVLLPAAVIVARRRTRADAGSMGAAGVLAVLIASPAVGAWQAQGWGAAMAHAIVPVVAGWIAWWAWRGIRQAHPERISPDRSAASASAPGTLATSDADARTAPPLRGAPATTDSDARFASPVRDAVATTDSDARFASPVRDGVATPDSDARSASPVRDGVATPDSDARFASPVRDGVATPDSDARSASPVRGEPVESHAVPWLLSVAVIVAVGLAVWQHGVAQRGVLALQRTSLLLPAYVLDRWSRQACASEAPLAVGGELPRLLAMGGDIGPVLACGDATRLAQDGAPVLAGLVPAQWAAAGYPGVDWIAALAAVRERSVPGVEVDAAGGRVREFVFRAPKASPVLLEVAPGMEILSVGADGFARSAVVASPGRQMFRCADCHADIVEWRIALRGAGAADARVAVLTPLAAASPDSSGPSGRSGS